jgi:hypothetical protein
VSSRHAGFLRAHARNRTAIVTEADGGMGSSRGRPCIPGCKIQIGLIVGERRRVVNDFPAVGQSGSAGGLDAYRRGRQQRQAMGHS